MSLAQSRSTDPQTSHEAAKSITKDAITRGQAVVLRLFTDHGSMTDKDLRDHYQALYIRDKETPRLSSSGLRTRRCELVDKGKLQDSGARRTLLTGRRAIVWELTK